jgi:hypothetical protein
MIAKDYRKEKQRVKKCAARTDRTAQAFTDSAYSRS